MAVYEIENIQFPSFNQAYRYCKRKGIKEITETHQHYLDRASGLTYPITFTFQVT